jgi:hypothetical protein
MVLYSSHCRSDGRQSREPRAGGSMVFKISSVDDMKVLVISSSARDWRAPRVHCSLVALCYWTPRWGAPVASKGRQITKDARTSEICEAVELSQIVLNGCRGNTESHRSATTRAPSAWQSLLCSETVSFVNNQRPTVVLRVWKLIHSCEIDHRK